MSGAEKMEREDEVMHAEKKRFRLLEAALAGALLLLTGCGGFFPPLTTTTTTTSTTGDYVYVANATTETISGYVVSTSSAGAGTLTEISGSPYGLSLAPSEMVITPSNSFLYVSAGVDLYAYAIGTGGVLTLANSSNAVAITDLGVVSMDVSPDGKWLFALSNDGTTIYEYAINTSTGVLTLQATPTYTPASGTVVPQMIKVAPGGGYVFVALGTGGDLVFPFTTSTGLLGATPLKLATGSTKTSDNALAVDSGTTYLYIARSGTGSGVAVYSIGTGGALTEVTGSPFAAGNGPYDVILDSTGDYVYAANRTDGTISGFSIGTGGILTALSGSPYTSGSVVTSLARDNSGDYVLAASDGGSPDLGMYSMTTGKLTLATSTTTGTDPTGALMVVATH
ncbi:lactonase family protein [Granulicella arctica]|uniref:6-phosphogluconolactonase (Cycloisomerase 2 family) n=1 Tax=Granulicella arctica TaxID=940613 RepID=A0A7Y9PGK3_9BACT|nr:beta-propeller fold lactonase family protein [Granulicella arctica]NYF79523.1 6-phosphogluconolactonase (cycloisomerase 2 family) [Granulicella arctica]